MCNSEHGPRTCGRLFFPTKLAILLSGDNNLTKISFEINLES